MDVKPNKVLEKWLKKVYPVEKDEMIRRNRMIVYQKTHSVLKQGNDVLKYLQLHSKSDFPVFWDDPKYDKVRSKIVDSLNNFAKEYSLKLKNDARMFNDFERYIYEKFVEFGIPQYYYEYLVSFHRFFDKVDKRYGISSMIKHFVEFAKSYDTITTRLLILVLLSFLFPDLPFIGFIKKLVVSGSYFIKDYFEPGSDTYFDRFIQALLDFGENAYPVIIGYLKSLYRTIFTRNYFEEFADYFYDNFEDYIELIIIKYFNEDSGRGFFSGIFDLGKDIISDIFSDLKDTIVSGVSSRASTRDTSFVTNVVNYYSEIAYNTILETLRNGGFVNVDLNAFNTGRVTDFTFEQLKAFLISKGVDLSTLGDYTYETLVRYVLEHFG